jgi:hypothetical protein
VTQSGTTRHFRNAFAALPRDVRVQARRMYSLFHTDPAHPSLRFKKMDRIENVRSVHID